MRYTGAVLLIVLGMAACVGLALKVRLVQAQTIEGNYADCKTDSNCGECNTRVIVGGDTVTCQAIQGTAGAESFSECVYSGNAASHCVMHLTGGLLDCPSMNIWYCPPPDGMHCFWCVCAGEADEKGVTLTDNTWCTTN